MEHRQMLAMGFTEQESADLAQLDPGVLQKIIALAQIYGLPAIRAALPFILVGDWPGALGAVLKLVMPLL